MEVKPMLMRIVMLPAALLLSSSFALAQSTQKTFPNTCDNGATFPFLSIALQHPIDTSCPSLSGKTSSKGSQAQNKVKNNFCATAATPEQTTPQKLIQLQTTAFANPAIKSHTGQQLEPTNRAALTALGEGKLVRMKAFLLEAHYADIAPLGGETVNCNLGKEEENDIHIAFGSQADDKECGSVSAEISPHYRPGSWAEIGKFQTFDTATKKDVVDQQLASRLRAQPYRITGQLFYDASHAPCPCGTNCNPSRASSWEIHPVYQIEVCKAGAACDESKDDDWIDFDTWWKSEDNKKVAELWFSDTYVRTATGWRYVFGQASIALPKTP